VLHTRPVDLGDVLDELPNQNRVVGRRGLVEED